MRDALQKIAKDFDTSSSLIKRAEADYGLDPVEALEYAYDNIQQAAKDGLKGVRRLPGVEIGVKS